MLKAPGRNRDDIVTEVAIDKVASTGREHIGRAFDAPARLGRHGAKRIVKDRAVFDFHKSEDIAAPGDQVDLAALCAKAPGEDTVSFQL